MNSPVMVIDYGIGNLLNVVRALRACGAEVTVVDHANQVSQLPERMVLPGVGAFIDGMQELRKRGFDDLVKRFADTQRPFLGICVGAQMLFEVGEEFEEHPGLGLIEGRVKAVPAIDTNGKPHRIPHIGWSALQRPFARPSWQGSLLADVAEREPAYFVHSFAPNPTHEADRLADTHYNGVRICAAVQRGALMGCQFHPERSAGAGLSMLKRFMRL
jgi:imidazole glycerol-phosphate synthase subunit HisH